MLPPLGGATGLFCGKYLLSPDFVNLVLGRIRLSKAKAPVVAERKQVFPARRESRLTRTQKIGSVKPL